MEEPYNSFAQCLSQCHACCFSDGTFKPLVPARVPVPVRIMFIGENPSWADGQNIPFAASTPSGKALDEYYLKPLRLTRGKAWITDLFKCRYPKNIYRAKSQHEKCIQAVAKECAERWLLKEIALAQPKIIVTLSDKQVYQRLRRNFGLRVPPNFSKAVGQPHNIELAKLQITLFPMVHPDISRPMGDGDNRKQREREKWSPKHKQEHIPRLKKLLKTDWLY